MNQKILSELRANLDSMSHVERKIAEVILADPKRFISFSLSELAAVARVSQGSIVNFSNKFSSGGFSTLKLEVAASVSDAISDEGTKPFSVLKQDDSFSEVFDKTVNGLFEALRNTAVLNDEETLKSVCDMILRAKKTEIYGIYRSGVVATDLCYQLLQLGIPSSFVSDVLTCGISASMLDRESLVIAISSSGQTQDVIDAVSLAKKNGTSVVAITAYRNSRLAKLADRVLISPPSGNSMSGNPDEIRFSQMAIADTICSYLRNKMDTDGSHRYFKMREILKSHMVKD